jgi:DNA-binding transcriptional ArsR family regulator
VSQPAVSNHLRLLRRAGVVAGRRQGRHTFYRLDSPAAADILRLACGP